MIARWKIDQFGQRMASCLPMVTFLLASPCPGQGQTRPLEPRDVLTVPELAEVQLAPDGRHVFYAVRVRDIDANQTLQSFWTIPSVGGQADSIPIDARASWVRWRPDGATISYLAPAADGTIQVWEYTPGHEPRQVTTHQRSVDSYEWSDNGRCLAFTATSMEHRPLPSQEGVIKEGAGIVIDKMRFDTNRLRTGTMPDDELMPPTIPSLWIHDIEGDSSTSLSKELYVEAYAWSPDGRKLAFTARRQYPQLAGADLLLYTLDSGQLDLLESGAGVEDYNSITRYVHPFWSPDGGRIGYFRLDMRHRWEAMHRLGVYSLTERRTTFLMSNDDLETSYTQRAFWMDSDTVLIEKPYRAGRRLFKVALTNGSVHSVVDSDDWFDQHSFSSDGRSVAFTRERINTPAELFVADRAFLSLRQLTNIRSQHLDVAAPLVERLRWTGLDGVTVEGWLYLPPGEGPFPTLVFVHGGPVFVVGNRYSPYLRQWPHDFGVYAARGIAVLVPNYRGTGSYGHTFRQVSAIDSEPVSDIIAGVDALIARGIADPERLGIAGHSYGGWLGPLVAVRDRRFVVGSFAEGFGNLATIYVYNWGWINQNIHDFYWGGGPFEDPERYRRMSPVYGFRGLRMATLFEVGAGTSRLRFLLYGFEYATAAWRAGMPHELVFYDAGHNIRAPRVMLESMERNLDWFEFWLLGRRHPDPEKRARYERWQGMREMQVPGEPHGEGLAEAP